MLASLSVLPNSTFSKLSPYSMMLSSLNSIAKIYGQEPYPDVAFSEFQSVDAEKAPGDFPFETGA